MGKLGTQARQLPIIVISVMLAGVVYLTLQSCKDDVETPTTEVNCTDGVDDDGDGAIDCADIDCFMNHPEICSAADGDSDSDQDGDHTSDGDTDQGDGGADGDGDTDTDVDVDSDSDADPLCDPDAGVCDWSCELHTDCVLVFDTLDCCGGLPHRIGEDMVACVTATHRDRLLVDRCALAWHYGDPIPTVPSGCNPYCEGTTCPPCMGADVATRAVCHEGECRALCSTCCFTDENCPEGQICADPTHEGTFRCVPGEHECDEPEDCLALPAYSECSGCHCSDVTHDGLRDCACYDCGPDGGPGPCTSDRDCRAHEFCIDRECVYQSEEACREAMSDCAPCGFCERDPESPPGEMRGHCIPLDWGDAGPPPDSGCE